jgi:hypothetical protein
MEAKKTKFRILCDINDRLPNFKQSITQNSLEQMLQTIKSAKP